MVVKAYPEEKVGVFAKRNGALEVVEYSGGRVGMQGGNQRCLCWLQG